MNQEKEVLSGDIFTSQDTDISIHAFHNRDFDVLAELTKTTYPGREISVPAYLEWEYRNNPDGEAKIFVAEKNENFVSQYIVLPRMFSIDQRIIKGSLSVNTLTHPLFRGNGLFKKLADSTFEKCRNEGIEFTIGFPNPVSLPVIDRKKIFEISGQLPLLVKPLRVINSFVNYIKFRKDKSGNEIEINTTSDFFKDNPDITHLDFNADITKYSSFLRDLNRERMNIAVRSIEFLKWRYVSNPLRRYIVLKLEENKKIKAIAVFRAREMYGLRCGILIDFFSLTEKSDKLIQAVKKLSYANNLDAIITTVPSQSLEHEALKRGGYYSVPDHLLPQKLAFITRRHLPSCPEGVDDFRKWFLTFGDYDIF